VQRHFGLPDPALIEKDWLVVKALAAITAADKGPFQLVFQGGTALSRAHRVIERMSEDIDIKIVSEGPPPPQALRRLRKSITAELHKAGFEFDPKNSEHLKPIHSKSRYTRYRLPYKAVAAGQGALRAEIQIETSVWPMRRPSIELWVSSFIAEAFKRPSEVPAIACAAIVETAAEKFVALTRRAGAILASLADRDTTLVRHIYDLHMIREHYDATDVIALARDIMPSDADMYGHQFPAYRDDPLAETLRAVEGIAASTDFANDYANFLRDMVYGVAPDFETAIGTLKTLGRNLSNKGDHDGGPPQSH
jgi:predicted nucleotidyltransferase component of viral defense system